MNDNGTVSAPAVTARFWPERVGAIGLYLFALFAWLAAQGAYLGAALMLVACVAERRQFFRALRRTGLLWAWLAVSLSVTLSTGIALLERPEQAAKQYDAGIDILILWGFLLVGWALRGDQQRLLRVFGLALAGFLLGRLLAMDQEDLAALANWQRAGFGLPVIAFGQYSSAALLGLVLLAPRVWGRVGGWPRTRCWAATALWLVLTLLAAQGVLLSNSRGVWVALAAVVLILLVAKKPPPGQPRSPVLPGRSALVVMVLGVLIFNSPVIVQRFAFGDSEFFDLLWAGRFEHIEDIAVQARLMMLDAGLHWWLERPWLGWGPGATPYLLEASGNPLIADLEFSDLHNIGVDMLVRLGLIGSLTLALGVALVFRMLRAACREGDLDRDLYLVLLALLALHFLCALTNFRVLNSDWRFYWMLFAGAAVSFRFFPAASPRR